jgi:endonuclease YncB( thermonuclease family)
VDERSDIYALGATLYEMLTLRPPFEGDTTAVIVKKGILDDPVTPRKYNPGVDEGLASICLKCLRKDADKRYQSAEELAQDLERFLDGRPVEARPPSSVTDKVRRPDSGRTLVAILVSVILLLGAYIVVDRLGEEGETPQEVPPATAKSSKAPGLRDVKVVWVVDGDTIHVESGGRKEKIRLLNINAPEQKQPFCKAAGKHLRKLLAGKTVRLAPESEGDRFTKGDHGRTLAFVFVGETNVNVEMVRAGLAKFFTKFGRGRFGDTIEAAEKEARKAKRGIWSLK